MKLGNLEIETLLCLTALCCTLVELPQQLRLSQVDVHQGMLLMSHFGQNGLNMSLYSMSCVTEKILTKQLYIYKKTNKKKQCRA